MKSNITKIFNELCEQHSSFFESWNITETRNDYYMCIKPKGMPEVCCGGKKKSAYEDRVNVESLINYAIRYSKENGKKR